jgi:cell division protein FtsZ
MDTVSLRNAKGVIANFTGGTDLSLYEVQSALTSLQEQTGTQTEIVFGVITDDRMEGRVQVILMITGLGASTLEEAMSGMPTVKPVLEEESAAPVMQGGSASRREWDLPPFFKNRMR